jgi:hypothetical protein
MINSSLTPNTEPVESKDYEITVQVRNSKGEITGKTKTFASDNPYQISKFWNKYRPISKKKKGEQLPNAEQAQKILNGLYETKREGGVN